MNKVREKLNFTQENTFAEGNRTSLVRVKSEFLERDLLAGCPPLPTKLDMAGAPGFPSLMNLLVHFL